MTVRLIFSNKCKMILKDYIKQHVVIVIGYGASQIDMGMFIVNTDVILNIPRKLSYDMTDFELLKLIKYNYKLTILPTAL